MERVASHPSLGESAKQVFYGIGKAVESQSPRAWNERIIRTINEKVIPKLTPDQLAFVAKHQKAIEGGVRGIAIAIPTFEIVAASISVQYAVNWLLWRRKLAQHKKIYAALPAAKKRDIALHRSYVTMPESLVQDVASRVIKSYERSPKIVHINEKWWPKNKHLRSLRRVLDYLGIQVTFPVDKVVPFVEPKSFQQRWFSELARVYTMRFGNSVEANMLVGTLGVMINRLSMFNKSPKDRDEIRMIAHAMVRNDASTVKIRDRHSVDRKGGSKRRQQALERLKKQFVSAFVEYQTTDGRWFAPSTPQAMIQKKRAEELFDRWAVGIKLLGFPDMVRIVEPNTSGVVKALQNSVHLKLSGNVPPAEGVIDTWMQVNKNLKQGNSMIPYIEPYETELSVAGPPVSHVPVDNSATDNRKLPTVPVVWSDSQIHAIEEENIVNHRRKNWERIYESGRRAEDDMLKKEQHALHRMLGRAFGGENDSRSLWFANVLEQVRSYSDDPDIKNLIRMYSDVSDHTDTAVRLQQQDIVSQMLLKGFSRLPKRMRDRRGLKSDKDVCNSMAAEFVWNGKDLRLQDVLAV